jgi:hypothetical protein
MIGKSLKQSVLDMPVLNGYQLYSGEDLGNHFEILLLPAAFTFELIEIWMPRSVWAPEGYIGSDGEEQRQKKEYSPLAGGYYAARLAVLERLTQMGRQASVLAIREISEKYWAPLGVWVVREVARQAMGSDPMRFSTLNDALAEMARRISTPMARWRPCSKLAAGTAQASLADFL